MMTAVFFGGCSLGAMLGFMLCAVVSAGKR